MALPRWVVPLATLVPVLACLSGPKSVQTNPAVEAEKTRLDFDGRIDKNSSDMLTEGRKIFRYDSFGSEDFWGGQLRLHEAILGAKLGGVGPGLTPKAALEAGLKVDIGKLPKILVEAVKGGKVSLEDPETTLELLRADSVVGVKGVFDAQKNLVSIGITCAICHSTVDDAFAKGIGGRLDGWPNRDLNIGAVVAMAPDGQAVLGSSRRGRSDGAQGAERLGPGPVRRGAEPGRQGGAPGRQDRGDPPAGGLRPRRASTSTPTPAGAR